MEELQSVAGDENFNTCRSTTKLQELNEYVGELIANLKQTSTEASEIDTKLLKVNEARWQLKHRLIHLMSYSESLLQLKEKPEKWLTKETVDDKVEEMTSEHSIQKKRHKDLQEKLKKLEAVLEDAEKVAEQRSSVEHEVEELNKKKMKFEKLKAEFEKKLKIFEGKCTMTSEAKTLIETQRKQIEERLQQICALETEMDIAESDLNCRDLEILKHLESFFTVEDTKEKCIHSDVEKSKEMLMLYEKLSGIRVKSTSNDCHQLEMCYGQNDQSKVSISLEYAKQKPPHPTKLIDVKINDCNTCVDDLVRNAIDRNDFYSIVPALKRRLETNTGLAEEVEELRKSSAIDWIPDKRCLCLIVGSNTCTLSVSPGYPGMGKVTLSEVKGLSKDEMNRMKPLKKEPTLTDWVNYLELHLGN